MNQLIPIQLNDKQEPVISGRELHKFLEVETPYKKWFDRMSEYGFNENHDFSTVGQKCPIANGGFQEVSNHAITLDMAKEVAMIQRNEKGKQARQYFIAVEKEYNSPEKIMARALRIADETIENLRLTVSAQAPKVLFADSVAASDTSILVGELAKIIKQNGVDIGQNRLFEWMRRQGYLISRKGTDYNMPSQWAMNNKWFEIKQTTINHSDGHISISKTPKVTGKGQQHFISKFLSK